MAMVVATSRSPDPSMNSVYRVFSGGRKMGTDTLRAGR
jgi:hypothetical protein